MRGPRLLAMLLLTTCCPPAPKTPTTPTGGGGGGSASTGAPVEATLDQLTEGQKLRGFTAAALYLDAADKPVGARFVHDSTGFTFDYLRIETAPQGFIWVTSFPTSDKGEPHTQEHLLLGKGDRGRRLGSSEAMSLATSSAFTAQWRTAYHFHTVAGQGVFWPVFENHLDALLNPDYTDEEIRREVRNFGVDKGDDGKLRLEEKGTVYNEMVRSYENPEVRVWRLAGQLEYGKTHPLALDSGGFPDAIREMTPEDIRKFHASAYHLANMGMIGAFPSSMKLGDVLDRTSAILEKEKGRGGKAMTEADLPKPQPAAAGTIEVVEYPYADTTNPGPLMLAYPPTRALDDSERLLLGLFLDAFAGDESTELYKKLIDSKTRVMDLGANGVWSFVSTDQGQPIYLGVSGVKSDKLDAKTIGEVRALVQAELEHLAKLPDGDPALVAFDARVKSRVTDLRRRLDKFLDSPPGFGFRGTSSAWMDHLQQLSRTHGFRKSVTMRPALAAVEQVLAGNANPWRDRVRAWGLLETPYGIAARPSPTLRKKLDDERQARIDTELARLQKQYGAPDAAATLAHYQQDYDAETRKLEASQQATTLPPLVDTPPMTLDDNLEYTTGKIGSVNTFTATFDAMASSRVQLAFRLNDVLPADEQMFLAGFPALLSQSGVIEDGKPIPPDEVNERLRKEVLELSVYYTTNARTKRVELVLAGAGNGVGETQAALGWMRRVMFHPDWRVENLPRLRDLVDQQITALRQRMLGAEEGWVDDPRDAWWLQDRLQAHTSSFLTQMHDLYSLRWMLLDPRDKAVRAEVVAALGTLAGAQTLSRAELEELAKLVAAEKPGAAKSAKVKKYTDAIAKLSPAARPIVREYGKDLAALLADIPDDSLARDWDYLTKRMAKQLDTGAERALGKLEQLRVEVFQPQLARVVEVGSSASQDGIADALEKLVLEIPAQQGRAYPGTNDKPFIARLRERDPKADPLFVGLLAPGTSSGVFLNLAPAPSYADTSEDAVLDYLAANLYTGHGAHSIFMKTWAAGLAYSNGLHPRVADGVLDYYAERCPLLPQTLRFVIGELKKAKSDPNLARYAIAEAFGSRIANSFESRAAAMAANLVDGLPPETVRGFRTKLLDLAKRADLADQLFARMPAVYGKVLPGWGKPDPNATYFVIGPEKQLAAYDEYLKAAVGKDAKLYRLYPRDFWIP